MESATKLWKFEALDSWFFRDGTPYNAGEGGLSLVKSSFPPYMNTMQGAVRVALAYGQGWRPEERHKWPEELGTPNDLGQVKLQGPYIIKDEKILLPAPLYLMYQPVKEGKPKRFARLNPDDEAWETDIGQRRLPTLKQNLDGAKVMEDYWLDSEGITSVLNGKLPNEKNVYCTTDLYEEEQRVGIERDSVKRSAVKEMLYSCVHVRPHKGVRLAVIVSGLPDKWHQKAARLVNLGGEGRMAAIDISDFSSPLLKPVPLKVVDGKILFTVTLITPGRYQPAVIAEVIENGPPGIPGQCVSACIGKLQQIGGWDSLNRRPLPLQPAIPAGSTWFYEADANLMEDIVSLQEQQVADPYGYGQFIIGNWEVSD